MLWQSLPQLAAIAAMQRYGDRWRPIRHEELGFPVELRHCQAGHIVWYANKGKWRTYQSTDNFRVIEFHTLEGVIEYAERVLIPLNYGSAAQQEEVTRQLVSGGVHWPGCWREHIDCAIQRIEFMSADAERARKKIMDFLDSRDDLDLLRAMEVLVKYYE